MADDMNTNEQGVPMPEPPLPPTQPQPPIGQQVPPPQQPYQPSHPQPQPQSPPLYMPAPLMRLTGGMKFGWFVVGALLGIGGILVAWLTNVDRVPEVKSDALKWSIIGFAVWIVLGILLCLMIGGMVAAIVAGAAGSYGYSYHNVF